MKVVTSEQMREIDRRAIEQMGIPGVCLMENAGREVAKMVMELLCNDRKKSVVIFCGKGNNGGDGFVAARHLIGEGYQVNTFIAGEMHNISPDAKTNFEILQKMNADVCSISDSTDLERICKDADIIVDALLGTGLSGSVRTLIKKIITGINQSGKPVVAVDVPSGLLADHADLIGEHIHADVTLTLGLPKLGSLFSPAREETGKLEVRKIGFPKELLESDEYKINLVNSSIVREMFPKRDEKNAKNACGKILGIAGSKGMSGAATLMGEGAVRSGAGLVVMAVPESLVNILEKKNTETMHLGLPETDSGILSRDAFAELESRLDWADVIVMGPGLGRSEELDEFILDIVKEVKKPLILDADGINAFAGKPEVLSQCTHPVLITPHQGEFEKLFGEKAKPAGIDRIVQVSQLAERYNLMIHFKGAPSFSASPKGEIYINSTGNCGMATGGTGDVLSGVIASCAGQGSDLFKACVCGSYLHGLSGDIAVKKSGVHGLTPSDMLLSLPEAIMHMLETV